MKEIWNRIVWTSVQGFSATKANKVSTGLKDGLLGVEECIFPGVICVMFVQTHADYKPQTTMVRVHNYSVLGPILHFHPEVLFVQQQLVCQRIPLKVHPRHPLVAHRR